MTVLLVGAGSMAGEYARVLRAQDRSVMVVGRGRASAQAFTKATGLPVVEGGLSAWLAGGGVVPPVSIVAVGITELASATRALLSHGAQTILLEKPGGSGAEEIRSVGECAASAGAGVYLAYNRRFYASTLRAKELIKADGGVTSFHFEFTELPGASAGLDACVRDETFLNNSTHVADLAFFLGGHPVEMTSYIEGRLDWHPTACVFAGAGRTATGVLFSYHANWESGGRWSVEAMTRSRRLIFRPLERLSTQRVGSFEVKEVTLADQLDADFKPGLFRLTEAVLDERRSGLVTMAEQVRNLEVYRQISPRASTRA